MGLSGLFGAVRRQAEFIPKMPGREPFCKRLQLGVLGVILYLEKLDKTKKESVLSGWFL